jgi:hypothetical protein
MTTKPVEFTVSSLAAARAAFAAPTNPFLTDAREMPVADDAPEGSYTYAIVQSEPAIVADEVETAAEAVEVMVRFGTTVLRVEHLSPPRPFWLGEADADVIVSESQLGASRLPLVLVDGDGSARLMVPETARGTIQMAGQKATKIAGSNEIALKEGVRAELEIGGLTVSVAGVRAGKKIAGRFSLDTKALNASGLSFLMHAGILAATALFMPPMAMADEGSVDQDQLLAMRTAIQTTAERDQPPASEDAVDATKADDKASGGSGQRAAGAEGTMGSQTSQNRDGRYSIAGNANKADLMLSKQQAIADAANFGFVGILNSQQGGPLSPTAPWGAEVAVGGDDKSYLGNMWGSQPGEAFGNGGLGLTGIGEGGGCSNGSCLGVGLGNIGTVGHGAGPGDGQGFGPGGFGRDHGRLAPTHRVQVPRMSGTTSVVNGRIPPEVIQRVVRQNFGRFRLCYENGLRNQPSLAGRVAVRFVIGHDGSVSQAANGGSDLPDSGVVSCVTRAFYGLSFPAPDSGIVTVTYPISFSPGG